MTIISAIIKRDFIIVASDSLIVRKSGKITGEKYFPNKPKFVAFPKLRCVVSYWGTISIIQNGKDKTDWDIHDWLMKKLNAQEQFESVEKFGLCLTKELTAIYKKYIWSEFKMLGIHLVGFESFRGKWIPELFLIIGDSNSWNFNFSRRTYGDLKGWENLDNDLITQREIYYDVLENHYSVYNNGDNEMFNHFFNSFHSAIKSTKNRLHLNNALSKEFFLDLATLPIKQVAHFQNKYYAKSNISVGGKVHALLMNSEGRIEKTKSMK
jgi:hypothetical protein